MIREELEFRIAQYADGTLPPGRSAAVEAELAAEPAARALLAEYRQLQQATDEAARLPRPEVRWDQLANRLSAVVASAEVAERAGPAAGTSLQSPALDDGAEFVIACYADGTLAPERRGEVEQLLATDARARALLDEYENLEATTRAVAYNAPFPHVNWDRLARHLSEAVDAAAGATLPEAFERQLSDYAQADLAPGERDEVESRLVSEPAARVALSEYQNLDAALGALPTSAPLPSVKWEQLAGRISAAVGASGAGDAEDPAGESAGASAGQPLRIAPVEGGSSQGRRRRKPAATSPIWSWFRSPMGWAAAASVLIAASIGTRLLLHSPGPVRPVGPVGPPPAVAQIEVAGLQPEPPAGSAIAEVQIGPPKELAQGGDMPGDQGDGVVSSPPRAFVASGLPVPKDEEVLPAMPF